MSGDGNPEVHPGDRIHITDSRHRDGLAAGTEHTVEYYGITGSGAVFITLIDQPVALISTHGDRWAAA